MEFGEKYGPWAFIAGASMGLGAALAHNAAERGLNVVMLARGEELLRTTADEVKQQHGVEVRVIPADLAAPDIGETVAEATDDLEVGLFVYNATLAPYGPFLEVPIEDQLRSVNINCITLPVLSKLFAQKMAARGRGGIGIVTSLGGTSGSINYAAYNAGKAFQWVFGETLWAELRSAGIDVNTLFVGMMSSPSFLEYVKYLDPAYVGQEDSDDPLSRARYRLFNPTPPDTMAKALYDQLPDGPACFGNPHDEFLGRSALTLPRRESIAFWQGLAETPMRTG